MSAKVVMMSVSGQTIYTIIQSTSLEPFLQGLLKKVFKTVVVKDYYFEADDFKDEKIVEVTVKSCWYKRQTKYKYTVACKAIIDGKEKVLLYHKMLHPVKANSLREQIMSSRALNLKYWVE